MRVCLFGYDLTVGASGATRFVRDLAVSLVDHGLEVTIATRRPTEDFEPLGSVEYAWIPGASSTGRIDIRFAVAAIATFSKRRGQFDVIHSVSGWSRFANVARLAGVASGTPVLHSALGPASPGFWSKGLTVHTTSKANVTRVPGAIHIPPFVDKRRFNFESPERDRRLRLSVGVLGAPDARKGIDVFAQAMALVAPQSEDFDFKLAIAPSQVRTDRTLGRRLEAVEDLLIERGLQHRATILGDVDVPKFLSNIDILVFPAQAAEGMVNPPLTVIEAMAAGCAIVASPIGNADEAIVHRRNGLLVAPSDKANASRYAELILELGHDETLRKRISKAARADSDAYDVKPCTEAFLDIYSEISSSRRLTMPSDQSTRQYYQAPEVVHEYDKMRFTDKGGATLRHLQEEAFLRALPSALGPSSRVLDMGCGTGRFLETLQPFGCHLVGFDASQAMLSAAEARIPSGEFVLGDALNLPFENDSFDLAYTVWVINHMESYAEAVREMCRVARGILLVVPNRTSLFSLTPVFKRLGGPRFLKKESAMGMSKHAQPPLSINFTPHQLTSVLEASGFSDITVRRSVLLPLIPNAIARWYPRIERMAGPVSRRFGTYMTISATKRSQPVRSATSAIA